MSSGVMDPQQDGLRSASRPTGMTWALLGASAAVLVPVAVLSALAAEGVEPFGGSIFVLGGLMGGAVLVVAGLTGVIAYGRPDAVRDADSRAADARAAEARAAAVERAARRRSSEQWRRLEERAERLARSAGQQPA
jgi:hypothetical protein